MAGNCAAAKPEFHYKSLKYLIDIPHRSVRKLIGNNLKFCWENAMDTDWGEPATQTDTASVFISKTLVEKLGFMGAVAAVAVQGQSAGL